MQYTDHYNLNLPEGTDIVNPLVQDNPNYTAIDSALYANKLRVIGTATELTTGTVHALTRADQDIATFKFVATSDYTAGDTFTVDGVSVTARVADGSTIPNGAFKINSTVLAILDGTILNLMNIESSVNPANIVLSNGKNVDETLVRGSVSVTADGVKSVRTLFNELYALIDASKLNQASWIDYGSSFYRIGVKTPSALIFERSFGVISEMYYDTIVCNAASSDVIEWVIRTGGNTMSQLANTIPTVGTTITLFY